ncbi:hypothetical protein [Streptomyces sp. SID12488]|uniref:hypothetical protein n=1 Tax=Streptomyces sp. SID12488 TaxID=2706040 RepID=UPI0013D9EE03|nr:hypothetical protein [Streptomyces sp. SID12488]NEA68538.1 hypothetical protein [Streptomyces sp. SID12488]
MSSATVQRLAQGSLRAPTKVDAYYPRYTDGCPGGGRHRVTNNSTNSCMSDPEFPLHPPSRDFAVLNQLYPKPGN